MTPIGHFFSGAPRKTARAGKVMVAIDYLNALCSAENRNSFDLGQAARQGRDFKRLGKRHERCS
jgi:hypothetical protein